MLIRPRLNDVFNLPFTQNEVDFAIPFLDEDLPLFLDPFLLWKSPSQQDNAFHTVVTNSFNHLGSLFVKGKEKDAISLLIRSSECDEVGLGDSKNRKGKHIGEGTAVEILSLYKDISQINSAGFVHFEEIQLFVDNIAQDRISDIACTFLKSSLIDYTISRSQKYNIPFLKIKGFEVYDSKTNSFKHEDIELPYNPENNKPILLVPRRWLRYQPWINYDDYFTKYSALKTGGGISSRPEVIDYNRHNYGAVQTYTKSKELTFKDCKNDPLFDPIPINSAKRNLETIRKLPTGKTENADRQFEDVAARLMASMLYPQLDFAQMQSRTIDNVLIRDLIFYNNRSYPFLKDIYDLYKCRQIVFELKNVLEVSNDHIDQLNRYLKDEFGNFGIILTRNRAPQKVFKNTVDLWAGQRKCILILSEEDIVLMNNLYKSRQRNPVDVLNKKYVEFSRACPS